MFMRRFVIAVSLCALLLVGSPSSGQRLNHSRSVNLVTNPRFAYVTTTPLPFGWDYPMTVTGDASLCIAGCGFHFVATQSLRYIEQVIDLDTPLPDDTMLDFSFDATGSNLISAPVSYARFQAMKDGDPTGVYEYHFPAGTNFSQNVSTSVELVGGADTLIVTFASWGGGSSFTPGLTVDNINLSVH